MPHACPSSPQQTYDAKEGKYRFARGPTHEEFVSKVLPAIKAAVEQHSALLKQGERWHYSWDNDSIHKGDMAAVQPMVQARWPVLPPYSPDMHCVVEHTVGRTWKLFNKMRRDLPNNPTMSELKEELLDAFEKSAAAATIRADVARLPLLYEVLCTRKHQVVRGPGGRTYKGSCGNWPEPSLYH